MTRSILRSSTALAVTLALASPGPLAAQAVSPDELDLDDLGAVCEAGLLARVGFADPAQRDDVLQRCVDEGLLTAEDVAAIAAQPAAEGEAATEAAEGATGEEAADPAAEASAEPEVAEEPAAEEPTAEAAEAATGEAVEEPAETLQETGEAGGDAGGDAADPAAQADAAPEDAAPEDEGAIVVDQAPQAEVEEGLATEDSAEVEAAEAEPADGGGDGGGDAEIVIEDGGAAEGGDAEVVIEGDEGPEGGDAAIEVDAAEGQEGSDGEIVVDQAPEAEVPEGLATADSAEAAAEPEAEAAVEGAGTEGAEGEAPIDLDEVDDGAVEGAAAEGAEGEEAPAAEDGEALGDALNALEESEEGGIVVDQAPQAEVEEGTATADTPATPEGAAEEPAEDAAEAEEATNADGATTIEEDTTAETEAAPAEDADALEEALEEADAEGAAAEEPAAEEAAAEESAEPEVPQVDTEAAAARANEAPAAAAAATDAEPAEEVEAQTLTEEDTRSSDEAFAEDDDGDDGLSNFERALLLGLGAATVGAVLNNGGRVVESTGDRVVVEREGELQVLKNDDELLRRPGATVSQRRYDDGSTLTVVEREDGTRVTTIRAASGQVLRRTRTLPDGTEVVLFDDTQEVEPVDMADLRDLEGRAVADEDLDDLRLALSAGEAPDIGRSFSLQQIRQIRAVRELMPQIDVAAVEFDTGSAVIRPSEAEELRDIGEAMAELVDTNPDEVFLVEGHTDAVGSAASNLALSDRRAESVALALTEYFDVPPENMIAQGYGEANLKVQTSGPARENRRATVRRITPLLRGASAQ